MNLYEKLDKVDWNAMTPQLDAKGYVVIPDVFPASLCDELKDNYNDATLYRKTVVMERYNYGQGEYRYFNYPLPPAIQLMRERIYPILAPVANSWMQLLKIPTTFPDTFEELRDLCHQNSQDKPTALILKYGPGGYNAMHQDLYGDIFFPMQLVVFLDEPAVDYTGGEFVLVQQNPRAQSTAIVLQPRKGDVLIFTTNFRPVKSTRGYYRANMKHGVSELHTGTRHTVGIIFHDALG